MKIIATPEQLKVVEYQHQPLARPNPLAEVVESLLQEFKSTCTKDAIVFQFTNAKKGQNHE